MDSVRPSQYLRKQLEGLGWTQQDLAFVLGRSTASVNQILSDRRGVTASMAKALGTAFDIDPVTLAHLQAEHDLAQADEPDPMVATRSRVLSVCPLREMLKREWIRDTSDPDELERVVAHFFGESSLDRVPYIAHAARRTPAEKIPPTQLAWLFRVRQIAEEMPTEIYSKALLDQAIEQMRQYRANREEVRHVPRLLSEAGVRFVLVEGLPGSNIDGACLWLDDQSPVIGMSLRFDRIDNFWFVLIHECAHVLHGHGRECAIVDSDLSGTSPDDNEEEFLANSFASEFCVPQDRMNSFFLRKNPFFSEKDVTAFAQILGVHPGLVVGQLQRRLDRYNFLRRHLVPIRNRIEHDAMVDGWGHYIPVG